MTPRKGTLGEHLHHKIKLLKALQANLAAYVSEEMGHLDVTIPEQGCYLEVLSEAIMYKVEVEEMLLQNDRDVDELATKELEEEFLVTRTVGSKEVWDDFENWVPSITAEYNQLVKTKEAVEQVTKRELHQRAEAQGKTIELLRPRWCTPAKQELEYVGQELYVVAITPNPGSVEIATLEELMAAKCELWSAPRL